MKETRLKLLQYVTGIGLLAFAGWHLWFSHFKSDEEVTTWTSVKERAASSGWLVFYILFLFFVVYHGMHGLRTIILEWFSVSDGSVKKVDAVLTAISVVILGYALYIPIHAY